MRLGEKAAAKLPDCLILYTSICERTRVLKRDVAKIARAFLLSKQPNLCPGKLVVLATPLADKSVT